MKKQLIILTSLFSIIAFAFTFSKAFSLYSKIGSGKRVTFSGSSEHNVDYYLKGSFNNWEQNNNYKLTDVTSSMTPETNKIKEYKITNLNLSKNASLKIWNTDENWYGGTGLYEHSWTNSIAYDGENYKVQMSSPNYTIYLKLYNNDTHKLYITATKPKLYFAPNNNWKSDGARFAAYFYSNNGNTWRSMTETSSGSGVYQVDNLINSYSSVIFCRMNPGTNTNNWDNKWNQTGDLSIPANNNINNYFVLPNNVWDGSTTSWTSY